MFLVELSLIKKFLRFRALFPLPTPNVPSRNKQNSSMPEFESVDEILGDLALLKEFRLFLRNHLALENLLFYEGTDLFESTTSDRQRQINGRFLINQFIKEESEDAINLPFGLREKLLKSTSYVGGFFNEAQLEVKRLMESNYMYPFSKHLNGDQKESSEEEFQKIAPYVTGSYLFDLSFDKLSEIVKEGKDGELTFNNCGCSEHSTKRTFCCEKGRNFVKINKIYEKMNRSVKRRSFKTLRTSIVKSVRNIGRIRQNTKTAVSLVYKQPLNVKGYPCFANQDI